MRLPSAAILSLLLLTGCDEKKPASNEPGASRAKSSSGRTQGKARPARPEMGVAIDSARQTLEALIDKGAPPSERADAVATLAASFAKEDPKGALVWIQSLENPEDRDAAWPTLILGLGEASSSTGQGIYRKLDDPVLREEYLAALTSSEVVGANPQLAWSYLQSIAPKSSERDALEDILLKNQMDFGPEKAWESYQAYSADPSEASFIKRFPLAESSNMPPGTGPKFPLSVITGIHDPRRQASTVAVALEKLDSVGRQVVVDWLAERPNDARFDSSYANIAISQADGNPAAAKAWAERITDEARRGSILWDIEAKAQEAEAASQ